MTEIKLFNLEYVTVVLLVFFGGGGGGDLFFPGTGESWEQKC